jgi:exodeoxyribonuclease V beta subunit
MMGLTGEAIHALHSDEAAWEKIVETFRDAHREWHEHGFIRMLRRFFQAHDIVCRLLDYRDGERRATNVLHLVERLHCEADARGMSGLITWLAARRAAPNKGSDDELLRLESDENLVKILTVHVAKGLEFPLVFCPFLWDVTLRAGKETPVRFHEPADSDSRAVLDFGSEGIAAGREQAQREERAENLRLLYVALTRAKYRCWMVWGRFKDVHCAAPAWLLHPATRGTDGNPVPIARAAMRADLDNLVRAAAGSIRVTDLATEAGEPYQPPKEDSTQRVARVFCGTIRERRRLTSFTGLAHGRAMETPDYDAGDRFTDITQPIAGRDIFAFPRGAHAGHCLHAVFEHVDFVDLERAELERIVAGQLVAHGFDRDWKRAVADMVQSVIATPLDASGGMRLDKVTRSRRLDELEFCYPIGQLTDAALRRVLVTGGFPDEIRERIGELTFLPVQGYMRGFIDLVFEHAGRYYLADYKSNWLGAAVSAYRRPALAQAMAREAYYLQYLIYCVALHRYLGARVPGYDYGRHFGGVRYLFLRGMRPEAGATCGVYSDRPDAQLIADLDDCLGNGAA